jgi:hypothetical protein
MGTVAVQLFSGLQVKVRALAGPLKDILRLVLLECEPPPQSEVLITLEQVFIKDLSVLCSVRLSLDPD